MSDTAPTIYPTLRYDDALAAVTFLTTALGFTEQAVHKGPDGTVVHAEVSHGNGIVMLSERRPGAPFDTGRVVTYIAVDDPDAHHDRAVAAGAEILMPLTDMDYGSREYAVADPEGNAWCFGTYRPAPKAG
jgi:uncharacterized glyoxalase superfamily protein PhnB